MPEEYRGTWIFYKETNSPSSSKEDRMSVGTKGIGWLKGLCNVTSVESNDTLTTVVKESCGGREVTELRSLRNLNGTEMLVVARIGASSSNSPPEIAVYVRDSKPKRD